MKALILNGKVVEIAETEFEVHPSMTWVDATADAEVGGSWDGSSFGPFDTRTDAEKTADAWSDLRRRRNKRLAETDYLALYDVTMSTEMQNYRQALRDLPANTTDPANPVWPTKPEA
jgi:hypothetical protein|tara:strand:+ start:852 stop:1202 length:351 start_codon:yes stop_codon:yes gene_type:complete